MWETILVSGITCLLALMITALFNWVLNRPKQAKIDRQEQEKRRIEDKEEILCELRSLEDGLYKKMDEQENSIDVLRVGMQASLKNDLKLRYDAWIKRGYAPIDAKDDLERMYQAYHHLGANGVMDAHREKFLSLPDSKKQKNEDQEL